MTSAPILFADFEPGVELGQMVDAVSQQQMEDWSALYPWDAPTAGIAPVGMATVLMMKAYLGVVTPRPPGNLHVQQTMKVTSPIDVGSTVTTVISCRSKELRKERRVLELTAVGRGDDGTSLFEGVITLFWAA